ncbi:MAG TPA: hypothetical protein V6C76_11700 [Drouetiella sp.]
MSGDGNETTVVGVSRKCKLVSMIAQAVAAGTGTWVDTRHLDKGSFEFYADSTATPASGSVSSFSAQIMGSNAQNKPDNTTDGVVIGTAVTTMSIIEITTHCRWMKIKPTAVSVSGQGALSARLHAQTLN